MESMAIKSVVAGFMECSGIKNIHQARAAMKSEALSLKQDIIRNKVPKEWTKRNVMLLRYIAIYKHLPVHQVNILLQTANNQFLVKEYTKETETSRKRKRNEENDEALKKNKTSLENVEFGPIVNNETVNAELVNLSDLKLDGMIEKRKVLTLLTKFFISPSPWKEVFTAFGTEINKDLFQLGQVMLRVANKIKLKTQLINPEQFLTKEELTVVDIYCECLKCGDRKRIMQGLTAFLQWARPRIGLKQEAL